MEEDIKILEELVQNIKKVNKNTLDCEIKQWSKEKQAIENLLTRYKEERYLRIHYENRLDNMERLYVDKDKIKEKIEELNKENEETYIKFLESDRGNETLSTKGEMIEGAIEVLQELLE